MDARLARRRASIRLEEERWRRIEAVSIEWEKGVRRLSRAAIRRERYPYLQRAGPRRAGDDPDDEPASPAA
jgi:hypothetical protein